MTTFLTSTEEFYECRDCETQTHDYSQLHHYDEDSGGFCPHCKSDNLKLMSTYIVYQQVYATDEDDAMNTAMEIDEWETAAGSIGRP